MCDENVFQSLAKYEPYDWSMRRLRSKIGPKVLIFKQASNESVELLMFEKPYQSDVEIFDFLRNKMRKPVREGLRWARPKHYDGDVEIFDFLRSQMRKLRIILSINKRNKVKPL